MKRGPAEGVFLGSYTDHRKTVEPGCVHFACIFACVQSIYTYTMYVYVDIYIYIYVRACVFTYVYVQHISVYDFF